uniref:Uncharacterized protein n=1 Tax=Leersia perrieri TaxID=77586 RepID=A0A0D9VW56_9ORYZ
MTNSGLVKDKEGAAHPPRSTTALQCGIREKVDWVNRHVSTQNQQIDIMSLKDVSSGLDSQQRSSVEVQLVDHGNSNSVVLDVGSEAVAPFGTISEATTSIQLPHPASQALTDIMSPHAPALMKAVMWASETVLEVKRREGARRCRRAPLGPSVHHPVLVR